jgi:hypothetical protein
MTYTIISLILFYIIYLLKNSKSDYFHQKKYNLILNWASLIDNLLIDFNFSRLDKIRFRNAYNYFIENPNRFDGATIVKDITQIKGLDIPAMIHDYSYIHAPNLKHRLIADWEYSQDMRKFEIAWTTAYSRMAILMIINLTGIYNIYKLFKK